MHTRVCVCVCCVHALVFVCVCAAVREGPLLGFLTSVIRVMRRRAETTVKWRALKHGIKPLTRTGIRTVVMTTYTLRTSSNTVHTIYLWPGLAICFIFKSDPAVNRDT